MAFCNSCGATLNAGTKFCNKCGATVSAPVPPAGASSAPANKGGSSALKIILIVVAVIVGLGILGSGHRRHRRLSLRQERSRLPGRRSRQSRNSLRLRRDLQRSRPGRQRPRRRCLSRSRSPEKRRRLRDLRKHAHRHRQFRKQRLRRQSLHLLQVKTSRRSQSTTSDQNRCTIVSNDRKNMVTINVEASGDNSQNSRSPA